MFRPFIFNGIIDIGLNCLVKDLYLILTGKGKISFSNGALGILATFQGRPHAQKWLTNKFCYFYRPCVSFSFARAFFHLLVFYLFVLVFFSFLWGFICLLDFRDRKRTES